MASADGAEHRAFELLDAMHAVGLSRNMPRLCIASLSDQVRLHARRFRPETSRALCARIDALLASDSVPRGRLWRRSVEWMQHLAHANAAIAAQEWRRALEALDRAAALAQSMQLGRVRIEVMALRAFALDRCGEKAIPLLKEAIDLAQTSGSNGCSGTRTRRWATGSSRSRARPPALRANAPVPWPAAQCWRRRCEPFHGRQRRLARSPAWH